MHNFICRYLLKKLNISVSILKCLQVFTADRSAVHTGHESPVNICNIQRCTLKRWNTLSSLHGWIKNQKFHFFSQVKCFFFGYSLYHIPYNLSLRLFAQQNINIRNEWGSIRYQQIPNIIPHFLLLNSYVTRFASSRAEICVNGDCWLSVLL